MGIALFYITSCYITYLSFKYFGKILVEDMKANNEIEKYRSKKSEPELIPWEVKASMMPVVNVVVTLIVIRITYSYHQYALGLTDYNILAKKKEGKS